MNKMLLKLDYQQFLVCADQKDEQALLTILGRAFVVKKDWSLDSAIYRTNDVPEIQLIDGGLILAEKPEPKVEVTENES